METFDIEAGIAETLFELREQSAAVLAMHGLKDSVQVRELMAPLVEGRLSIEEHRSMLEILMQRLQNG